MAIICEFDMCVYNNDNKCILYSVKIGVFGNCETGVTPSIPKEVINFYKDDMLKIFSYKPNLKS